jgi:uncharacterized protein YbgA (DUF1722 family)
VIQRLPPQLRPNFGGLTPDELSIYQSFEPNKRIKSNDLNFQKQQRILQEKERTRNALIHLLGKFEKRLLDINENPSKEIVDQIRQMMEQI